MNKILLLLIIDSILIATINVVYLELGNKFDLMLTFWISFFFFIPFMIYGIIKLILKLTGKKGLSTRMSEKQLMYKFALYLWEHYNFDIFAPNFSLGNKKENSKYRYPIKYNRCYPADIEKVCLEIPDTIIDSHTFNGLETKILLYFNSKGEIDNDRIMNDETGWDWNLLEDPLNFYLRGPQKTEKAEKLLERIYKEKGEIPEELVSEAIREEIRKA